LLPHVVQLARQRGILGADEDHPSTASALQELLGEQHAALFATARVQDALTLQLLQRRGLLEPGQPGLGIASEILEASVLERALMRGLIDKGLAATLRSGAHSLRCPQCKLDYLLVGPELAELTCAQGCGPLHVISSSDSQPSGANPDPDSTPTINVDTRRATGARLQASAEDQQATILHESLGPGDTNPDSAPTLIEADVPTLLDPPSSAVLGSGSAMIGSRELGSAYLAAQGSDVNAPTILEGGSSSSLSDSAPTIDSDSHPSHIAHSLMASQMGSPDELIGRSLGPWNLGRLLGKGGMGAVYEASHPDGRRAAVKVILPSLPDAAKHLPRFRQEAKVTAQLEHPNIVRFYEFSEDPLPYIVLEYVDGQTLGALLKAQRRLPIAEAIEYSRGILAGLGFAHEQLIIHRDLKPDNVLLGADGRLCLADFGLGRKAGGEDIRLTHTGSVMGTPLYMAPEQLESTKHVGPATDLYAFGVMLFQMIAGQPPFTGGQAQIVSGHLNKPAPDVRAWVPRASRELAELIQRLMAKDPSDRFSSAAEILSALETLEPEQAAPSTGLGARIDLGAGDWIEGWRLEDLLGAGGMGKVFRASRGEEIGAIKVLSPSVADSPNARERFEREVSVTQDLVHPNIVEVLDSGVAQVRGKLYPFMALEFVGPDLSHFVDERGPLPPAEAVAAALGACRALSLAHARNIVHRDVKPENLLVKGEDITAEAIRLGDFGLVALTDSQSDLTLTTAAVGSPFYMAPEQAKNTDKLDGRADIYALGATLYYLLTGARMFTADTYQALLIAHATELPLLANERAGTVPEDLALIVDYAVLKQPDDRPEDIEELARDLEAWRSKSLSKERLREIRARVRKGRRPYEKQRGLVPVLIAFALVTFLAVAFAVRSANQRQELDPFDPVRGLTSSAAESVEALEKRPSLLALEERAGAVLNASAQAERVKTKLEQPVPRPLGESLMLLRRSLAKRILSRTAAALDPFREAPYGDGFESAAGSVDKALTILDRVLSGAAGEWVAKDLARRRDILAELCSIRSLRSFFAAHRAILGQLEAAAFELAEEPVKRLQAGLEGYLKGLKESSPLGNFAQGLLQMAGDSKTKREAGIGKLRSEFSSLEKSRAKASSTKALAEAQKALTKFVDRISNGNPKLAAAAKALRDKNVGQQAVIAAEEALGSICAKYQELLGEGVAPRTGAYDAALGELAAFEKTYRDNELVQEVVARAGDSRRRAFERRNQAAAAAFRALCAEQDARLGALSELEAAVTAYGAGDPSPKPQALNARALDKEHFTELFYAIVQFPKEPGLRGWAQRENQVAARIERLAGFLDSYPARLLALAWRASALRPRRGGRLAFLGQLSFVKACAQRAESLGRGARDFILAAPKDEQLKSFSWRKASFDQARLDWIGGQLDFLRSLHDGERMKRLPGGKRRVGRNDPGFYHHPGQIVTLSPYWIDVHEVSVGDYARFLDDRRRRSPDPSATPAQQPANWSVQSGADQQLSESAKRQLARRPVTNLTWDSARDYALWAGKRLPTEQEWEAAARRSDDADAPFPWGRSPPSERRARFLGPSLRPPNLMPVDALKQGQTRKGLLNMVGNAAEWTASDFVAYPAAGNGAFFDEYPNEKVVRGGSIEAEDLELPLWIRAHRAPSDPSPALGFRCASQP